MTPLIKKEIRLLLPAGIMAVLLALPPICTRADDGIPVFLMFLGLAMLALSSIGRETSLNTFSSLLALPVERTQIWRVKLSVLAGAFLIVFAVWRLAVLFSFHGNASSPVDPEAAEDVLIAGCFVTVATFTGGLWSALLLRQLASAFWLTLLVPAVLGGITAGFASLGDSNYAVIAALGTLMMAYSLGGFLFARWLFFRAQDIGWTGGIITLSGFRFTARSESADSSRRHRPFLAVLKKEFQLQHASLVGAAALFTFHTGVIIFRHVHKFARESTGDVLTSIVWMIWLVFPILVSCLAIAEERRLGVMDAQLCLSFSRRRQFVIKWCVTLFLGIFLGSILPLLLEFIGANHLISDSNRTPVYDLALHGLLPLAGFSLWLVATGFFASSLARNFLQGIGYACATVVACTLPLSALLGGRMFPFYNLPTERLLTGIIALPVLLSTLLWLAWLNYKNFHENWYLWRRNLLGLFAAFVFVAVISPAIYNRAWERFEPEEPAHDPAKMSLAQPPQIIVYNWADALVRLPDGQVWYAQHNWTGNSLLHWLISPVASRITDPHYITGSNWVSVATGYEDFRLSEQQGLAQDVTNPDDHVTGYLDVVGIRNDGTLWISDPSSNGSWMGDHMERYDGETNWQQVVRSRAGVLLLKNDGTLWRWGTNRFDWSNWRHAWPTLHDYQPYQIGSDTDWREFGPLNGLVAKSDGTVWYVRMGDKTGGDSITNAPDFNGVPLKTLFLGGNEMAYVRPDGTLWARYSEGRQDRKFDTGFFRVGTGTNWIATTITWSQLSALKSDGTIWQWRILNDGFNRIKPALQRPPTRVGIHSDWVAITRDNSDLVALAADGSLWLWPERRMYEYNTLLKLPKQPRHLGNVFDGSN